MGLAVTKQEAFWEACGYGRIYEVEAMLKDKIINVNWKSYTHNCCPIHVASQGKPEIVRMLLDHKCDVNAKDDRDNLPIHHAAMRGHTDIIQMLLDAGSLIDAQDKNGWTPMINAAYWCQPGVIELLIKNRANCHLKNKDKRTALHEACRSQSQDEQGLAKIVELLAECGCDVDSKSSDVGEADFTPLMFCAYHGHTEVAKVLIKSNCKINEQGSNGWSALHWAVDRNHHSVVQVLLQAGIDMFLTGRREELAIHRAKDKVLRQLIKDAMEGSGDRRALDLPEKNLYIPRPLSGAGSPTSPMTGAGDGGQNNTIQAIKEQMTIIQSDLQNKRSKRSVRRPIESNRRLFQPPAPPEEARSPSNELPSVKIADMAFEYMDDSDEEEAKKENNHMENNHDANNHDANNHDANNLDERTSVSTHESSPFHDNPSLHSISTHEGSPSPVCNGGLPDTPLTKSQPEIHNGSHDLQNGPGKGQSPVIDVESKSPVPVTEKTENILLNDTIS